MARGSGNVPSGRITTKNEVTGQFMTRWTGEGHAKNIEQKVGSEHLA